MATVYTPSLHWYCELLSFTLFILAATYKYEHKYLKMNKGECDNIVTYYIFNFA